MAKTTPKNQHPAPEPQNRLAHAAGTARDGLDEAAARTVEIIEENPLAVIAGGLAVGAIVAALIPKSRREMRLLAPVGRQITERAKGAVDSVKAGASEQIGALAGGEGNGGGTNPLVQSVLAALATAGLNALQKQGQHSQQGSGGGHA